MVRNCPLERLIDSLRIRNWWTCADSAHGKLILTIIYWPQHNSIFDVRLFARLCAAVDGWQTNKQKNGTSGSWLTIIELWSQLHPESMPTALINNNDNSNNKYTHATRRDATWHLLYFARALISFSCACGSRWCPEFSGPFERVYAFFYIKLMIYTINMPNVLPYFSSQSIG